MKLKSNKQLNRIKDERKLLLAVADLIEAGRQQHPIQISQSYASDVGACDMGCLYLTNGSIRGFGADEKPSKRYDALVLATMQYGSATRFYWHNGYWRDLDWRDRGITRLGGENIHDFVTDRNDHGFATGATVAALREAANARL